jgi:hypothetical protein
MNQRRAVVRVGAVALALVLALSGVVDAASATITPSSQTNGHLDDSTWSLTWGGGAPYDVYFIPDTSVGFYWERLGTNTTSWNRSMGFAPCTTTTFHQELDVYTDKGTFADDTSTATVSGGNPC